MALKSIILKPYAKHIYNKVCTIEKNAIQNQSDTFRQIIQKATPTLFGNDHDFIDINSHKDFVDKVPIRDYEQFKFYINKITQTKESNILWPGKPKYLAKTSGTTSGIKYIPLTDTSIQSQILTARFSLLNYMHRTGQPILDGKVMFLSGSPYLNQTNGIPTGRLSGIVNHEVPGWLKKSQKPSYTTNCIDDWESKLDQIVEETYNQNMTLISGIPPWVQMYFERLLQKTKKSTIKEVFPNLQLFAHGGVNYTPYKNAMEQLIGGPMLTMETYPASEGFIAFQNDPDSEDLLLNTNAGLFYEFVELNEIHSENPTRLILQEVEKDKDYAIIISSDAGLWAYNIGDTVRFTSLDPYKIVVSGRIKHFISAFGEHVISKEIEHAMQVVSDQLNIRVIDFTVAPQVNPPDNLSPYHEWFIEFAQTPQDLLSLEKRIDQEMVHQNIYYKDLIAGGVLRHLKVTPLRKDAFRNYMKSMGKLGGQNKVPRLMNNREIADSLDKYIL